MNETRRRTGAETKAEAQMVALTLFGSQGYEATSMRQIAEALGINKASLYYHFAGKEEIVRSVFETRGSEVRDLLHWVEAEPDAPDLLERAVLRWIDSFSVDKLRGIRFVNANPRLLGGIDGASGARIGEGLEGVAAVLTVRESDPRRVLLVRMAFLSINAAVAAAAGTDIPDEVIVVAARDAALALMARLTQEH
ncbi:TetR/AcrR family transcriptional regulator [Leifsonia poae]|uniref:TetR/AcrR family transcriptional regulator n=1 Tax=Leifsonia poae TaxID=110933 RepID=UPI001CBABFBC|nr:TetR/AcrR family transcriptional regulator [Leifsonia poae]